MGSFGHENSDLASEACLKMDEYSRNTRFADSNANT